MFLGAESRLPVHLYSSPLSFHRGGLKKISPIVHLISDSVFPWLLSRKLGIRMTLPEFDPRTWDETSLGLGRAGLDVRCRYRLPGDLLPLHVGHLLLTPQTHLWKSFSLLCLSTSSQKSQIENEGPGSFSQISIKRMHSELLPWTYWTQSSNIYSPLWYLL